MIKKGEKMNSRKKSSPFATLRVRMTGALLCALSLLLFYGAVHAEAAEIKLKLQGSTTVNPVAAEAAEILHREKGWNIFVDTQGGSSGGISALGDGLIDIGMISKPVSDEDRQKYPKVNFRVHAIGIDGVALIVSKPVWDGGVHVLTKRQVQGIYESKIKNWKEVSGPDAPIVFYNKEPGRGTWEVFADWAYNGHKNAPLVSHPEVGANEEARNKVASHPSAISQLSFAWAEGSEGIKALGIRLDNGSVMYPNAEEIRKGTYPLVRTLYLVTNGDPKGPAKEFIDFVMSERGQVLVKKNGYLPIR